MGLKDWLFGVKKEKPVEKNIPDLITPRVGAPVYQQGAVIMPYPTDVMAIETICQHSPIAVAIINNIRNEVFRKDLKIVPKFGTKCISCNREYEGGKAGMGNEEGSGLKGVTNLKKPGSGQPQDITCPKCGYRWQTRVMSPRKCPKCDFVLTKPGGMSKDQFEPDSTPPDEMDTAAEQTGLCEDCGGELLGPDQTQKEIWKEFSTRMNSQGLTFREVVERLEDDLQMFDDAYLLMRFDYSFNAETGEIVDKELIEVQRGAPGKMRIVMDERARKGKYANPENGMQMGNAFGTSGFYTCIEHRMNNMQTHPMKCPKCQARMVPVWYVSLNPMGDPDTMYIEGEVFHWSKYKPSEGYGFSPMLTCWTELKTLMNIDRFAARLYETYRPPKGFIFVRTRNVEAVQAMADDVREKMKADQNYLPIVAVESEAGERFAEWLPLTQDWNELQTIPLMKEMRERIEAVFGVSNVMMSDTSASGGLNNEGMQITVTLRTIERAQSRWSAKVLPVLLEALKISDYILRFPPPIEEDRVAVLERRRINLELMERLLKMGASFQIIEEEDFQFKMTSPPQAPSEAFMMQMQMDAMGGGTDAVPGDPRQPDDDKGGAKPGEANKFGKGPPPVSRNEKKTKEMMQKVSHNCKNCGKTFEHWATAGDHLASLCDDCHITTHELPEPPAKKGGDTRKEDFFPGWITKDDEESPFLTALVTVTDEAIANIEIPPKANPLELRDAVDKIIRNARTGWEKHVLREYATLIAQGMNSTGGVANYADMDALSVAASSSSPLWGSYAEMGREMSNELNRIVVEAMVEPNQFSMPHIRGKMQRAVHDISRSRLENIARTEGALLVNQGREFGYSRDNTPADRYIFMHSGDMRECDICTETVDMVGDGKSLEELKGIIAIQARKRNGPRWKHRDWSLHPGCRGVLLRIT